ncbi:MAG: PAP2 superfamily protein [Candidatus Roizmanbacteria bacterium GW2011_GWA2_35_19]|uniref:PAP2 superfamily protein n=2 Tax=Candidatus Roizmaniibacteriota TaxID=1752723 RepID=A0A0G0F039_9BACT|nr:MAG: PAP2 superfamily protein [Candidatus Roizmanbacteria bacterium GW2011_GWC2_35_12]KKP72727.1 MAG: PAP2 superfamily protein [Candidatus Roizmanbacteria bacterium GW2011_GWA2_35_19]
MDKFYLLALFLLVKSIYIPLNKRKSKYYWKIIFDDHIPFIPIFIIPYVSYFLYIIATIFLLWNTKYIYVFFVSYIISYILAGLFWYFFPNGVKRPIVQGSDIFSKLILLIYKHDEDTNGFPSAHIFATLICSYFLYLAIPTSLIIILTICLLITLSTVFVKQHYVLDILGGLITFLLSILAASFFLPL